MDQLKKLSEEGVPAALAKAEHYRLLNDPWAAESICLDILEVQPDHTDALINLILAQTDQFGQSGAPSMNQVMARARELQDDYMRAYYCGIVAERQAKAQLSHGGLGSGHNAYAFLHQAMTFYEEAERLRPGGDDSALLRWNTCVRMLQNHPNLGPATAVSPQLLE